MGRKDEKKWKRGTERVHEFWEMPLSDSVKEKDRARDLRHTSWWRQKIAPGICSYCGQKVPSAELTMDHIIPLSRGGRSERSNIVPACKECNNKKKYLLPSEWEEYLEKNRGDSPDLNGQTADDGEQHGG